MATIRFYPKPERSGRFSIVCMVSHASKEKPSSLGYMLTSLTHWDSKKQRAKSCLESTDINAKINTWEKGFSEYAGRVKRQEAEFDFTEAFNHMSGGKVAKKRQPTLNSIFPDFVSHKQKTTKGDNASHYETAFKDISEYEQFINYEHKLTDIKTEFYLEYGLYLAEERDNINSTINRKIGRVRTLMDWAFKNSMIDTQRYAQTFYFKNHDSGRFPLTEDEKQRLSLYDPESDFQRLVKKAFLFACETGLRVSDLQQLRPHHLVKRNTKYGVIPCLDLTQGKGTVHNYIALSNWAMELLEDAPEGAIYDFKYSQSANVALKKVCKEAGLNRMIEIVYNQGTATHKKIEELFKIVSFHWARNTYISLLLEKGLQAVFVKGNAGHKLLNTTMIYSKQDDDVRMWETLQIQNKTAQN